MDLSNLHALAASDAARLIREGVISSEQYVAACLARVRETDARIEAWAFLDPDHALEQARAADRWRLSGQPIGPLHGVPIGIKDIIDTADMPTENGSPLHAGRPPSCVVHDEDEFESSPRAHTPYRAVATEEAPIPPAFGFVKTPHWSRVDPDAQEAFAELIERLGDRVEEVELAGAIERAWDWHGIIMEAEVAVSLAREWDKGRARLSERLRGRIERGRSHGAADYLEALAQIPRLNEGFTELFEQKYDALLTPAATGIAPAGLASTGDPMFCSLWTLCGLPALSVPLMSGANGLPLGVQLVGARHGDGRLLRTARWLVDSLRRA